MAWTQRYLSVGVLAGLLIVMVWLVSWQWHDISWASVPAGRGWYAAAALVLWLGLCGWAVFGRKRHLAFLTEAADWLVAFASQTGFAEQLAQQTATTLRTGDRQVDLVSMQQLSPAMLENYQHVLFVVSTTGEGDAPDDATGWPLDAPNDARDLSRLRYGMLALGDSRYTQFCGFGRRLDDWLQDGGAQSHFPRIEVDNANQQALMHWQQQLANFTGARAGSFVAEVSPQYRRWRLQQRLPLAKEGDAGQCFSLSLTTDDAMAWSWQAGDIARVALPGADDSLPMANYREYSIASLPAEGELRLLVRQRHFADGQLGEGSRYLTHQLAVGDSLDLCIRRNQRFHLPVNDCPLILIGNGTGIAGLRALLQARASRGQRQNWLIFGRRYALAEGYYRDDINRWQAEGFLPQLDYVYSRETATREYVQHRLYRVAGTLRDWVNRGAAIYVCGSRQGMASDVDTALVDVLGAQTLDRLRQQGRYRRDVY